MSSRLETLKERFADNRRFLLAEQRSDKPSKIYINDLQLTITAIENEIRQLTYGRANPVKMID